MEPARDDVNNMKKWALLTFSFVSEVCEGFSSIFIMKQHRKEGGKHRT